MVSCALVFTPSPKSSTMIRYFVVTSLVEQNCEIITSYSHPTYNERLLKIIKIDRYRLWRNIKQHPIQK